jgi:hypothetical protein
MAQNIMKILAERREKLSKDFQNINISIAFFFLILVGPEVENDSDSSQEDWSS